MKNALLAGLAGALALNVLHETVRRLRPADAPRMDVLGMRALTKAYRAADSNPPPAPELHTLTLAADILANGLYFSLVGNGDKNAWWRGTALGVAAGVGGVLLPGPLGLGYRQSNRTPQTQAMTVAWYTLGGIVAAAVARGLKKQRKRARAKNQVTGT